jgi:peptide/nickel transport system permease protein
VALDVGAEIVVVARTPLALAWRRMRRDRVTLAALVIVALIALVALLGPLIAHIAGVADPNATARDALDPRFGTPIGPSWHHLFGVDSQGRDVLSRTVYGARLSLAISLAATAISLAIGLFVGLVAGYFRGSVDALLARLIDVVLSFPLLLFALGLAAACSTPGGCVGGLIHPGAGLVILVIGLSSWAYVARVVRGVVISLREQEFVLAARGLGASSARILAREILPNLTGPVAVLVAFAIPGNMLFEAGLAFLGVGVSDRTPTWGSMVADAAATFDSAWWYLLFPSLAIGVTAVALNLLGEGLQDAISGRRG